ncbi:MAG: serine/threonine protein kinase [Nannocystaceae bacterium]|nr:serine/threonine protein kinase [Nannocystaceae bacterium]
MDHGPEGHGVVGRPLPSIPFSVEDHEILAEVRAALFGAEARPPRVGRYELGLPLGHGGSGWVFRARDPSLGRDVAIKLIRGIAPRSRTADLLQIRGEARALARLTHPNVVAVFDIGEYDLGDEPGASALGDIPARGLFVAMELLEGVTLEQWLTEVRTSQEIIAVFRQCALGLAAAHDAGLVHRDFKPTNVMVTADGVATVLDFGLATVARRGAEESLRDAALTNPKWTNAGAVLGTPWTMAPEQHEGRCDARSDQYSLCYCLHEALFGHLEANTLQALLALKVAVPLPRSHPRKISRRLARALDRGLSEDPARRFVSLRAWLDASSPAPWRSRGLWAGATGLFALTAIAGLTGRIEDQNPVALVTHTAVEAREYPTDPPASLTEAFAKLDGGQFQRAQAICDRVLTEVPDDRTRAAAGVCLAESAGFAGDSGKAVTLVEPAYWMALAVNDPYLAARAAVDAALFHKRRTRDQDTQLWIRHALAALARSKQDPDNLRADLRIVEASLRVGEGDLPGALPLYIQAHEALLATLGSEHRRAARADLLAGNALENNGQHVEGLARQQRALAAYQRLHDSAHLDIARALNDRATSLSSLERAAEAKASLQEALAVVNAAGGAKHPIAGMIHHNLGHRLVRDGNPQDALAHYRLAIEIREVTKGSHSLKVLKSMTNLGNALLTLGRHDESERVLLDNVERFEARGPHPLARRPLRTLASLYVITGDSAAAVRTQRRAEALETALAQPEVDR